MTLCYNINMKKLDISVIIPFKDHPKMTIACLESLKKCSLKEILLVDNGSKSETIAKIKDYLKEYQNNVKLLHYPFKFNYQKINNWAAKQSTGKVLWLLNNDVEVENPELVEEMFKESLEKETGATGCVLLYEDKKTIQHAGVYLIPGKTADHLYIRKKISQLENQKLPYDFKKNLSLAAVTAASLMVEKTKFEKIGGLNENFIITGGDVDLCLRLAEKGWGAKLIGFEKGFMLHKESISRSHLGIPYVDFVESYKIYSKHFNTENGDGFIDIRKLKGYL